MTVSLTQGKETLIDDEDFEKVSVFKWWAQNTESGYYAVTRMGNKLIYLHRFLLGIDSPKMYVDHKDRNGLNNRKNNLRIANASQNGSNRKSKANSASSYLGVSILNVKIKGKIYRYWRALINTKSGAVFLGSFKTEKEAAIAYNEAALLVHGEFANINIIDP